MATQKGNTTMAIHSDSALQKAKFQLRMLEQTMNSYEWIPEWMRNGQQSVAYFKYVRSYQSLLKAVIEYQRKQAKEQ
jgi:hypothetical protein